MLRDVEEKLRLRQGYSAMLCTAVFVIIYGGTTYYTKNYADTESIVFPFESRLPFLQWFLIPYVASGIFFGQIFFWCRTKDELRTYTKRFLMAAFIADAVFLIFPLRNSFIRPDPSNFATKAFHKFIEFFDSPYNQAPSLHVTYAILYWTVIKSRFKNILRWTLFIFLILMILSTVFVYQHHVIDVFSGLLLGILCIVFVKH